MPQLPLPFPLDITALLNEHGLTIRMLLWSAFLLFVLFVFTSRLFFLWFFKINKIVRSQEKINQRIAALEKKIAGPVAGATTVAVNPLVTPTPQDAKEKAAETLPKSSKFEIRS